MLEQTAILEDGRTITVIHFTYAEPSGETVLTGEVPTVNERIVWKIACMPDLHQLAAQETGAVPYQRTDDARAANCPLCLQTSEYKAAMRRNRRTTRRRAR